MSWCGKCLNKFVFVVLKGNLYFVSSFQNCLVVSTHPCWNFSFADNDHFSVTLFTNNYSVIASDSQCLNLFAQVKDRLRWPLIFINWRISSKSHVLPKHQASLPSSSHQRTASVIINNAGNFVSCHINANTIGTKYIKYCKIVILVSLQMPKPDHILVGAGRK